LSISKVDFECIE